MTSTGSAICSTLNQGGRFPVLLVCDHASFAVPDELESLGLSDRDIRRHIGWDIGALAVTRALARALDAPAVVSHYSRLVVDLNRSLDHPESIRDESDGTVIPRNRNLSPEERNRRIEAYFHPYHRTIRDLLEADSSRFAALVSIHSFTPELDGVSRPWHAGILWSGPADGLARRVLLGLRGEDGLVVGENVPYAPEVGVGYTVERHGDERGLPNVLVEIRQDTLGSDSEAETWAERLACVLEGAIETIPSGVP